MVGGLDLVFCALSMSRGGSAKAELVVFVVAVVGSMFFRNSTLLCHQLLVPSHLF